MTSTSSSSINSHPLDPTVPIGKNQPAPSGQADEPTGYLKGSHFRRYLSTYTVAMIAIFSVWGALLGIVLPNHIQMLVFPEWFRGSNAGVNLPQLTDLQHAVDAGTAKATPHQEQLLGLLRQFNTSKAQALAIITSAGLLVQMLLQPLLGVMSDRTRSRMGRRAPWILWGAIVGGGLLILARFSPTLAVLGLVFTVAQMALTAASGPLQATVADRVVESKRGLVSGLSGFGLYFGSLLGAVAAGILFASLGLNLYIIFGGLAIVGAVLFVVVARDRSSKDLVLPAFQWREFFVGFTIALRVRNFRWVWIARIILSFGFTVSTALSLYMLQGYVRPALSVAEATSLVPVFGVIGIPLTLAASVIAGRLSDRLKRRRSFVIAASVLMSISMAIPLLSPTIPGLLAQTVLGGFAFGIYLPVDQALFIDLLPDKGSAGRDLGVAALAANLGQAIGPLLAGLVVTLTGGYSGVWIAALVLTALAAVAMIPVRGIR